MSQLCGGNAVKAANNGDGKINRKSVIDGQGWGSNERGKRAKMPYQKRNNRIQK